MGLGELLRWQQEEEDERGRLASAQSLMGRALRTVEPKHLAMISKLRSPPRILCAVLEMARRPAATLILTLVLPTRTTRETARSPKTFLTPRSILAT